MLKVLLSENKRTSLGTFKEKIILPDDGRSVGNKSSFTLDITNYFP
jgi:hypothetical protein